MALEPSGPNGKITRSDLKAMILDFDYLAALHFDADLHGRLASLNKTLQADLLENSFSTVIAEVESFLLYLDSNYISGDRILWGKHAEAFIKKCDKPLNSITDAAPGKIKVGSHYCTVTKTQLGRFCAYVREIAGALQDAIQDRFCGSLATLKAFLVFVPSRLTELSINTAVQLSAYGLPEIKKLAAHYKDNSIVDSRMLEDEWAGFRSGPLQQHKGSNLGFRAFVKKMLNSAEIVRTYPNICKLLMIAIIMPLANAICERGFSAQNHIKSKRSASMTTTTLDQRIRLYLHAPTNTSDEYPDFAKRSAKAFWRAKPRFANRAKGAHAANAKRRANGEEKEKKKKAASSTANVAVGNDGSNDVAGLVGRPVFSDDKWKIKPGAPDVSVEKELKNKKAAHWFDEPPGWQVGKFKKMYKVQKPDETGKKVITNYKWHFMNATHSSIFRLRKREYGDRGLASWCMLAKK